VPRVPGEANHEIGRDGARRAKRWLESTTRVRSAWTNEEANSISRLEFDWPYGGQPFPFDVGGLFYGGAIHNQAFVVEVKKYTVVGDQRAAYGDWLAKAYLVRKAHHRIADQFLFMTWHPFAQTSWTTLCEPSTIVDGILQNKRRIFSPTEQDSCESLIDQAVVTDLVDRLWLIVLSNKQEELVITKEHRALIVAEDIRNEVA